MSFVWHTCTTCIPLFSSFTKWPQAHRPQGTTVFEKALSITVIGNAICRTCRTTMSKTLRFEVESLWKDIVVQGTLRTAIPEYTTQRRSIHIYIYREREREGERCFALLSCYESTCLASSPRSCVSSRFQWFCDLWLIYPSCGMMLLETVWWLKQIYPWETKTTWRCTPTKHELKHKSKQQRNTENRKRHNDTQKEHLSRTNKTKTKNPK